MRRLEWLLDRLIPRNGAARFLCSIVYTVLMATGLIAWGTWTVGTYGWGLFVCTPFAMGLFPALIECYRQPCSPVRALMAGSFTLFLGGAVLLLSGVEGALCILMASPLAVLMMVTGAVLGSFLMESLSGIFPAAGPKTFSIVLILWPLSIAAEPTLLPQPPVYELTTSVRIAAPPEKVWESIVSFEAAPPPEDWLFQVGIAYPIRAEIDNPGPNGLRRCVFSTGAVVEPIEVWDPPRQLSFTVTASPAPMVELSPYRNLHPPHLQGFLISTRGRLLLHRLEDGGTLLEGTSWYKHSLWPAAYWKLWCDPIIRRIHLRVFRHIQALSEGGTENGNR